MSDDPHSRLERAFHEPKRLAIMSALLGSADQELAFGDLKRACDLTDGNLSRHLSTLEEAGAVAFRKVSGKGRPQTHVAVTAAGRRAFLSYLDALEEVLRQASEASGRTSAARMPGAAGAAKPSKA